MKRSEGKIGEKDYWECPRCGDSIEGSCGVPCPRGGCEAEKVGTIILTLKENDCEHNSYRSIGHQGNGHQECTVCGHKKPF